MASVRPRGGRLARALDTAILASVTIALVAPIARHGSPIGHDSYFHLLWAAQFADSLDAGVRYPRWLPDVNAGLGNPTFVFYPPLLFYAAAILRPLAGSIPSALDLAAALALFASGVGAYAYLRAGLGRAAALIGALVLMALPYHLLDLYQRAALAEFAAFAWPPLALLALRGVVAAPGARAAGPAAAGLALAVAGLALTHLPSLLLWGPVLAAAALTGDPAERARGLCRAWPALALGLGLAAVFLLPALVERRLVRIELLALPGRAEDHTLFSPRAHWFNTKVSVLACWQTALAVVAGAAVLWPGTGRPRRQRRPDAPRPSALSRIPAAGALGLNAAGFALMTSWSTPLWVHLPLLAVIQFPWRLLLVLTPATALLVACAAARASTPESPRAARALGAAALVLLAANLALSVRGVIGPALLDRREAARYASDPSSRVDAAEYRPRSAPVRAFPQLARAASLAPGGRAAVPVWEPTRRLIVVRAPEAGRLRVATFNYPGWRASVDGRPAEVVTGPAGVIEVPVPAGRHEVEIRFGLTPLRAVGLAVAGASGLVVAAWAAAARMGPRIGAGGRDEGGEP